LAFRYAESPLQVPESTLTCHSLGQTATVSSTSAFYDISHAPADYSNRKTSPKDYAAWEIHPVMKMEVIQ
jgi:hypothetical protein